jgi:hypothetical protein
MSAVEHARQWGQWGEAQASAIVAAAAAAPLHGSPQWDALLHEAGAQPLSADERQHHASAGPPRASGPSPIEVRRALEALRARLERAAEQLQTGVDAGSWDDAVQREIDALKRIARGLVDEQLRRYIAAVRPKITTSSIFANALASSRNYAAEGARAGMSTLSCDCCGAPRQRGSTARVCEFCGSTL